MSKADRYQDLREETITGKSSIPRTRSKEKWQGQKNHKVNDARGDLEAASHELSPSYD